MKFTNEDLMKAMGLKVGDRVVCLDSRYIFKVIEYKGNVYLECENANLEPQFIHYLLNVDFEILPQPKRVGDLKCGDFKECNKDCPIKTICQLSKLPEGTPLYELFKDVFRFEDYFDQEIYDLLKARLDKEVKDND